MAETLLPLSHVRSLKLTLGDRAILRVAARELGISEAEVMRVAIRRFAFCDAANGLEGDSIDALRIACAGLSLGPPSSPTVARYHDALLARLVPPRAVDHDFDGGPHGRAKLAESE